MGGRKRKVRKIAYAAISTAGVLLAIYFILINVLVSAALVPSFMRRLDAFSRITDESYAAQVQTADIRENGRAALADTKEWLKTAKRQKLSIQSEDGFMLVAETFPLETSAVKKGEGGGHGRIKDTVNHRWVILLHGYTGWKEELYPLTGIKAKATRCWRRTSDARGRAKGILSAWGGQTILTVCSGFNIFSRRMKMLRLSFMGSLWERPQP